MSSSTSQSAKLFLREIVEVMISRRLWSKQFAIFASVNYIIAFAVIDVFPREISQRWWAVCVEIICVAIMLALGLVVRNIMLSTSEHKRSNLALNVTLAIAILIITNTIGSPLLQLPNKFDLQLFIKDVTIGFFGGAYISLIYVVLFAAFVMQQRALRNLEQTRETLLNSIHSAEAETIAHADALVEQTVTKLLPEIEAIRELLKAENNFQLALAKLQSLISSKALKLATNSPDAPAAVDSLNSEAKHPDRSAFKIAVRLREDLKPLRTWAALVPGVVLYVAVMHPGANLIGAALATLPLLVLLYALKFLPVANQIKSSAFATAMVVATCLAFCFVVQLTLSFWHNDKNNDDIFWMALYASVFVTLSSVIVLANRRAKKTLLEELAATNIKLSAVNEVLHRNLWVATSKWNSILHSKVKSSLTRSVLKLSQQSGASEEVRNEVALELQELLKIAPASNENHVEFFAAADDTISTWSSIFTIQITASDELREQLVRDSNLGYALNEILKEIISNLHSQVSPSGLQVELSMATATCCLFLAKATGANPENSLDGTAFTKLNTLAPGWTVIVAEKGIEISAPISTLEK